ncbi:hypothetical protein BsWGS_04340 [Bradybaena similaris]
MAVLWQTVNDIVWAKSFWLPGNYTWEDLKNKDDGIYHPQITDLLVPVYLSVFVYVVRICLERLVFGPVGRAFGLKSVVKKAAANPVLENLYRQTKAPSNDVIQGLSKETDLSIRQIERWFRIRRNQDRTPVFKKFLDSSWRGLFYFAIFWYGIYLHLDKPWFYDTVMVWKGWPHHHVSDDIYWYYMVEGAFYISLLFSLFTDHKRKDFSQMVIHHVATLLLMSLSWINNFVRIGTLVLVVHDAVDSWMEAAKVAKYIGYDRVCEICFFIFMLVWIITRMIIFPFRIIRSTLFEAVGEDCLNDDTVGWLTMYSVYNILLCTLQVLHIIWFYYICLVAVDAFRGQMQKDSRSSLESASETDGEKSQGSTENNINNGRSKKEQTVTSVNGVVRARPKPAS